MIDRHEPLPGTFIINADDYGLTPGVSCGIREAHRMGILTPTTTVMMNFPHASQVIETALNDTPKQKKRDAHHDERLVRSRRDLNPRSRP